VAEPADAELGKMNSFRQPAHEQEKETDGHDGTTKTSHQHLAIFTVRILLHLASFLDKAISRHTCPTLILNRFGGNKSSP
jgi:hypothetical protein